MPTTKKLFYESTDSYIFKKGQKADKIKRLQEKFQEADNYRSDHYERWEKNDRVYRKYIDQNTYPFKSKVFVPLIQQAILTIYQNTIPALFEDKKFFELINLTGADDESGLLNFIETVLLNELYVTNNFVAIFGKMFLHLLRYGIAIPYAKPARITKTDTRIESGAELNFDEIENIENISELIRRMDLQINQTKEVDIKTDIGCHSPKDVWVNKSALSIKESTDLIIRNYYTADELYEEFSNAADHAQIMSHNSNEVTETDSDEIDAHGHDNKKENSGKYIVYEYYINTNEGKYHYYLLNNEYLLEPANDLGTFENINIYDRFPAVDFHFFEDDTTFYSDGLIDLVRDLQHEVNDARNMRRDNIFRKAYPSFLYDESTDVDVNLIHEAIHGGGKSLAIRADMAKNNNPFVTIPFEDVTGHLLNEETMLKGDLETTTSTTGYQKGTGSVTYNSTARGVLAIQQAAMKRLNFFIFQLQEFYFKDFLELLFSMIQKFYNAKKIFEIIAENNYREIEINPVLVENLRTAKVNFFIKFTAVQKELIINKYSQALNMVIQIPGANPLPLVENILSNLDIKNLEEILPDIPKQLKEINLENLIAEYNLVNGNSIPIPEPDYEEIHPLHIQQHRQCANEPNMNAHIQRHYELEEYRKQQAQQQMAAVQQLQQQQAQSQQGGGQGGVSGRPTNPDYAAAIGGRQNEDLSNLPPINQVAAGGY